MIDSRMGRYALRVERYTLEEQWLKNIAYWSGKQHIYIINGQLYDATKDLPEHRVIYRANFTRGALLRAAAKVVQSTATMRAIPPNASMRSRSIAEMSEKVVEHQRHVTGYDERLRLLATLWAGSCGSGFFKMFWDAKAGEFERYYIDKTKAGTPAVDPHMLSHQRLKQLTDDGAYQDYFQGEVSLAVESPFATFWDWSARDAGIDQAHWMASRHWMDIDRVAEIWNVDPDDLSADSDSTGFYNYEEAIAFMSSATAFPFNYGTPEDKRGTRCEVVDMWERPSRDYPRGRRVVLGGGMLLCDGDNPHMGDRSKKLHLPYVKQDWVPHMGRFIGASLVEDLTNLQYNLNESAARVVEFLRVFGSPPTFVGSSSGINPEEMTIEPGGIYVVNEMSKGVTHGPVPQLPPGVVEANQMCRSDLLAAASNSDVDGSKLPGQMRSGDAVQRMNDERYVTLSITASMCNVAAREVCERLLALGQINYVEDRFVRFLGDSNQFDVRAFTGADLTNELMIVGDFGEIDRQVRVRTQVMDAAQMGAIQPQTNPTHARLVMKVLQSGSAEELIDSVLAAMKHQEREIQRMAATPDRWPEGYPVSPLEDHAAELEVCLRYMYSAEFESLPDAAKGSITAHATMHQRYLKAAQFEQMQMLEMAKGAPGQKGTASQPAG